VAEIDPQSFGAFEKRTPDLGKASDFTRSATIGNFPTGVVAQHSQVSNISPPVCICRFLAIFL